MIRSPDGEWGGFLPLAWRSVWGIAPKSRFSLFFCGFAAKKERETTFLWGLRPPKDLFCLLFCGFAAKQQTEKEVWGIAPHRTEKNGFGA